MHLAALFWLSLLNANVRNMTAFSIRLNPNSTGLDSFFVHSGRDKSCEPDYIS